jgi:hypothetical protein
MALEDLPFFFMRWGAHISFLQDAITQKPSLRQNRRLIASTVGWRATQDHLPGKGCELVHRSKKFYLNWNSPDACPNGCARKIRATTYAAIFPRFTSCTPSALNGDHCRVMEQPSSIAAVGTGSPAKA